MTDQVNPGSAGGIGRDSDASKPSEGIRFLDLLIVVAKRKRLVLGFPIVMAILAGIGSVFATFIWTGTVKMLPPQQSGSTASALLNQLGGALGGLTGLAGGALGVRNSNDLYVAMLKSRTLQDSLIVRFDLVKHYDAEKYPPSDTRKILDRVTTITSGREGIVTIEVEDKDPQFAAELANAYVDELEKLTKVIAVTEASRRRLFFEQQLSRAKDSLAAAEIAARQGLEKGGITQVEAQGRTLIEVNARLRAQISATEVQIAAMRNYAAERNPDLQRSQQELAALKGELARIEGSSPGGAATKGDDSAKSGFDSVSSLRNVKYYEFLYEFLAKQYEIAKIDESKDATIIQVMDKAVVPDRRTRPKRTLNVIIAGLVSGFIAVIAAFVLEALEQARKDPEQVRRFQTLIGYLRFWRAK